MVVYLRYITDMLLERRLIISPAKRLSESEILILYLSLLLICGGRYGSYA